MSGTVQVAAYITELQVRAEPAGPQLWDPLAEAIDLDVPNPAEESWGGGEHEWAGEGQARWCETRLTVITDDFAPESQAVRITTYGSTGDHWRTLDRVVGCLPGAVLSGAHLTVLPSTVLPSTVMLPTRLELEVSLPVEVAGLVKRLADTLGLPRPVQQESYRDGATRLVTTDGVVSVSADVDLDTAVARIRVAGPDSIGGVGLLTAAAGWLEGAEDWRWRGPWCTSSGWHCPGAPYACLDGPLPPAPCRRGRRWEWCGGWPGARGCCSARSVEWPWRWRSWWRRWR